MMHFSTSLARGSTMTSMFLCLNLPPSSKRAPGRIESRGGPRVTKITIAEKDIRLACWHGCQPVIAGSCSIGYFYLLARKARKSRSYHSPMWWLCDIGKDSLEILLQIYCTFIVCAVYIVVNLAIVHHEHQIAKEHLL